MNSIQSQYLPEILRLLFDIVEQIIYVPRKGKFSFSYFTFQVLFCPKQHLFSNIQESSTTHCVSDGKLLNSFRSLLAALKFNDSDCRLLIHGCNCKISLPPKKRNRRKNRELRRPKCSQGLPKRISSWQIRVRAEREEPTRLPTDVVATFGIHESERPCGSLHWQGAASFT